MQVMRHHHIIFLALLITSGLVRARSPSEVFASDLEKCIREHAAAAARTFPQWGDSCMPPTEKIDIQAALYDTTLASIQHTYGYTGSLWCSFYSLRMTGKEYNPNDSQPNNPNYFDWYKSLLCPWDLSRCENEPLGMHGDEWKGVPVGDAPNQNAQYLVKPLDPYVSDEPDRRTMSCGLCGWLKRKLGEPPFTIKPDPLPLFTPGAELYTANWDFHPFGSWLANQAARTHENVDGIVQNINIWRASNGEEIHGIGATLWSLGRMLRGFLWQSTRLLAYESQSLSKQRLKFVDEKRAIDHVLRVCKPSWWLAPQSRDDCSHAAGHGFFYYFLDVGRAVSACWTDEIVDHTPGPELDRDTDTRHSGLNAADLLKWRWLCSTGVYHSAGNTLSSAILQQLSRIGTGAEQYLCKHADSWGDHARFFDRCSAGLGMKETEGRLELVRVEKCKVPHSASGKVAKPAAWELKQLSQFGQTMQLSCNPAKYFVQANDQCPLAYRAHFPCEWGTKDYDFCTGRIGGAIVKGPTGPRGVVWETPGTPPNYLTFYTIKVTTALTDEQVEMIPQTRWAFFDTATKTGLLKYDPEVTREELPEELKETVVVETLLELDHVVLTSLAPIILDNTATVTPYHELCMSHEILRETFRCEHPPPPPEGQAYVKYAEDFVSGYPLGVWGGSCTCPDGRVYTAGDNGDLCGSLACFGGVSGPCQEREGIWAFREVHCAPMPPKAIKSLGENIVEEHAFDAGVWGSTCTCPDGEVYLVGDAMHGCDSMSCYGGTPGPCIKNTGAWSHRKVTCSNVVTDPTKEDANKVLTGDPHVGEFGGTCTCPDGSTYLAGAIRSSGNNRDACGDLACVGGVPGLCNQYRSVWSHQKVICAPLPPAPPSPERAPLPLSPRPLHSPPAPPPLLSLIESVPPLFLAAAPPIASPIIDGFISKISPSSINASTRLAAYIEPNDFSLEQEEESFLRVIIDLLIGASAVACLLIAICSWFCAARRWTRNFVGTELEHVVGHPEGEVCCASEESDERRNTTTKSRSPYFRQRETEDWDEI